MVWLRRCVLGGDDPFLTQTLGQKGTCESVHNQRRLPGLPFRFGRTFAQKDECTLFTYADDTQLLKSAEDIDQVEHAINADLKKVYEWYEFNQMQRNHSKYQAITFGRVEGRGWFSVVSFVM